MKFRELLRKDIQRQLQLIDYIYHHNYGLTARELKKQIGCSNPIFLSDIKQINETFTELTLEKCEGRYYLRHEADFDIQEMYRFFLRTAPEFLLFGVLFHENCYYLEDAAAALYLSTTKVYRLLEKLQVFLQASDIQIKKRPLRLEGDEKAIRLLFSLYFREQRATSQELIPKDLEKVLISALVDHLSSKGIRCTYEQRQFLFYSIYTAWTRLKHNHPLACEQVVATPIPDPFDPSFPYQKYFLSNFLVNGKSCSKDIYWLLSQQYYPPYYPKERQGSTHGKEQIDSLIVQIDRLLIVLERNSFSSFEKRHDFFLAICNEWLLFYPQKYSFVFFSEPSEQFVQRLEETHPQQLTYYHQLLKDVIDPAYFDFFKSTKILFLLFTTFPDLPLLPVFQKRTLHLLVYSHLSNEHAKFLKNFFERRLTFSIHLSVLPSSERASLIDQTYDLIITTIHEHWLNKRKLFITHSYPTDHDIQVLEKVISRLL